MDQKPLYDEDIYAWAQQQSAVLRSLAASRRYLPNELDLENVAEEIEDVGKSELHRVESFVRLILIHLLKAASAPRARSQRKWHYDILAFRADLLKNLTPAMRGQIDLHHEWHLARLKAEGELSEYGDELLADLPDRSPLSLEDLTGGEFDVDQAIARIRPSE